MLKVVRPLDGNNTTTVEYIDTTKYVYDSTPNNRLNFVKLHNFANQKIEYDLLGRVKDIYLDDKQSKHINYVKRGDYASNLVSSVWYGKDGIITDNTKYSYDSNGNITKVMENGKETVRYTYDELSRLMREDNKLLNKTYIFAYDVGGNITSKQEYQYSLKPAEFLENGDETIYGYANAGWKDQLGSINGTAIEYDDIGNPQTHNGNNLNWRLRSLTQYGNIAEYSYNASGIRTDKYVGNKHIKFFLDGTKILAQDDGNFMQFFYGVDGVLGFNYNYAKLF